MSAPICPIHHKPLVQFCPTCRGITGGQASTPAKREAAQANARKPRPRARKAQANG